MTTPIELVRTQQLKPAIDNILPLSRADEAFRILGQRKAFGKIMIDPWS